MASPVITVLFAGELPHTTAVDDGPRLQEIGRAETSDEAAALTLLELPDVMVLDTRIPDPDAPEICRRMRERAPACRILTVAPADDDAAFATIVAGAMGCVIHDVNDHDLSAAIVALTRGESLLQPNMATQLVQSVDQWARRSADPLNPPPSLTATEREVLTRLGTGMSPETIASLHAVTPHLVNLHAGFAVGKLHRYELTAQAARES